MTDIPRDQRTVVPAFFRIYSDDRETYRQIKEETGLPTDAQVFSQLVHAFYDPVHIQDDRQQLQQQLDQATDALQHLQADYQQLQSDNQQLRDQAAAADLRINELQQQQIATQQETIVALQREVQDGQNNKKQ